MGSQIVEHNGCSRTYWTPAMEQYFIELMLEHVQRGNRVGHTFNKQAWTDMLAVFNAKFGSHYDKDVLKNRYTSLWDQFNDVQNLLGHGGFSWDEAQKMVVADECVWAAYLKAHPEARVYRTKSLLNLNDLCLIYGYTIADGRYSRSSHDADFDDEAQEVEIGESISSQVLSSSEHSRTDWTPSMDQYFIELLLDQVKSGNKSSDTFCRQAWTDMLTLFNARFRGQYRKRVLRHRYRKLWKYFIDASMLLKTNDFSWDETQQMIIATDDVWDTLIKVYPHARAYRGKTLPNYNDLVVIYGNASNDVIDSQLHKEKDLKDCKRKTRTAGGGRWGGTSSANDRTRTFWTAPMDQYFINLLLDQALKGNKLGQTFIAQAWTDMVTYFNAYFKSNYEKDVLKNRYKHLRKQYNDIKNLLNQDGFSWNETREMVTADEGTWNAYIKGHPDARPYRVKTVSCYDKLCVIFGEENFDVRNNRLAHDFNLSIAVPVLMTDEEKNEQLSTGSSIVEWTEQMDHGLIDLMLAEMHGRNEVGGSLDDAVWLSVESLFNDHFGLDYDRDVLESRYIFLMKQCDKISYLLSCQGFSWNENLQMVTAENDVWAAHIKEFPDAIKYKDITFSIYEDLCKISPDSVKDGSCSLGMETGHNVLEMQQDGQCLDHQSLQIDVQVSEECRKRLHPPSLVSGCASKMQKTEDIHGCDLKVIGTTPLMASRKQTKSYKIEGAIHALQALPDIDDDLLLDACDLLEDEKRARTFLALNARLRKKWLLRKLHG